MGSRARSAIGCRNNGAPPRTSLVFLSTTTTVPSTTGGSGGASVVPLPDALPVFGAPSPSSFASGPSLQDSGSASTHSRASRQSPPPRLSLTAVLPPPSTVVAAAAAGPTRLPQHPPEKVNPTPTLTLYHSNPIFFCKTYVTSGFARCHSNPKSMSADISFF